MKWLTCPTPLVIPNFFSDCDSERRKQIVDTLNEQYEEILQRKLSIFATYSEMVEKNSFRVLSSFAYNADETALRSDRIAERPPMSDIASDLESVSESRYVNLPSPFLNLSGIPEHDNFIQMVINAKATADLTNKPAQISWRGFTTNIIPGFQLTKNSLRNTLLDALQRLNEISATEQKVN